MDEPTAPPWSHLRYLLLLLLVAAGLRGWQVVHTEVTTRDSIAYIRYAWRLEHEPFVQVARTSQHHPGYPALIALAGGPARALLPGDPPRAMQLAAQLVACLAGVLLVVPMYFLGVELFDRRVGFWGALLFQTLPSSGRLMPDGLTEPLFLLLAATALLAGCRAVRSGGVGWYALAGFASGLAYLTRTEGLVLAGVVALVLLLMQARKQFRRPWLAFGRDGAALAGSAMLLAVPFMATIGGISAKPSVEYMIDPALWQKPAKQAAAVHAPLPLAVWNFDPDVRPQDRYGWAAYALVAMIDKGFFHLLTLPLLIGLFAHARRAAASPPLWVPLGLMAVMLPLLYRLAQSNGYLGERHVMLIVLCGVYWAAAALLAFADWLPRRWPRSGPALAVALFAALLVAPLPKTMARLHGERAGFRQAGEWLAAHAGPDDLVIDPFAWSTYYAGRTFVPGPPVPPDVNRAVESVRGKAVTCYVVLDRSRSKHAHLWYLLEPAERLARQGEEVTRFEGERGAVVVYRVRLHGNERASRGEVR